MLKYSQLLLFIVKFGDKIGDVVSADAGVKCLLENLLELVHHFLDVVDLDFRINGVRSNTAVILCFTSVICWYSVAAERPSRVVVVIIVVVAIVTRAIVTGAVSAMGSTTSCAISTHRTFRAG